MRSAGLPPVGRDTCVASNGTSKCLPLHPPLLHDLARTPPTFHGPRFYQFMDRRPRRVHRLSGLGLTLLQLLRLLDFESAGLVRTRELSTTRPRRSLLALAPQHPDLRRP